ncbi:MAG: hypothetical protein GC162_18400 [Planctomycetes bacterium]|nr:hypothetical protein [Planctomycetota bacterium]
MSTAADRHHEFESLIEAMLDGQITAAGRSALQEMVRSDAELRRMYARMVVLHASLDWLSGRVRSSLKPTGEQQSAPVRIYGAERRLVRSYRWLVAAVIAIAVGVWFLYFNERSSDAPARFARVPAFATLTDVSDDAQFMDMANGVSPRLGETLANGTVSLDSGTAQIMFNSTAVVDMTGPCRFEVTDVNRGRLTRGQLHAFVPAAARGFVIETPNGVRFTDLGTEFDVSTARGVGTLALVRKGRIDSSDVRGDSREMTIGQWIVADANGRWVRASQTPPAMNPLAMVWFNPAMPEADPLSIGVALNRLRSGVSTQGAPVTNATDDWIIEAWARPAGEIRNGIVAYNGDPSRSGFGILRSGNHWAGLIGGVTILRDAEPIAADQWVHLALARRGGMTRLYIDGQLAAQSSAGPRPAAGEFSIGGFANLDQDFNGQIYSIRIARLDADYDPAPSLADSPNHSTADGPLNTLPEQKENSK